MCPGKTIDIGYFSTNTAYLYFGWSTVICACLPTLDDKFLEIMELWPL